MRVGQHLNVEAEHGMVGLLNGECDGHWSRGARHERAKRAGGEHGRPEGRIEHWCDARREERKAVVGVHVATIDTTTAVPRQTTWASTRAGVLTADPGCRRMNSMQIRLR